SGVGAVRMSIGPKDASGRRSVDPVEGSEFRLNADLIIKALGFEAEDLPVMFNAPQLKFSKRGVVETRPGSLETSIPGVFAAGDIVRGASLVVWAIVDGRKAAAEIIERVSTTSTTLLAAE
ncbi:MAG: FAD-dependent oxidoreductase, partial [Parvularculaceae bacterium]|nr:FAD-dependent oxidoreductase [Parvularculaceae bacterium]